MGAALFAASDAVSASGAAPEPSGLSAAGGVARHAATRPAGTKPASLVDHPYLIRQGPVVKSSAQFY
jgi:hypothetical protein